MVNGKLLIFVDLAAGLDDTGRGLLSFGSRLAGILDSSWGGVTSAFPDEETVASFGAYGVPAVVALADGDRLQDTPALLGKAVAQLAREEGGRVVVLPHNDLGSILAPVVAAELDAALITEVIATRSRDGALHLSRQALGGRVMETRVWDGGRPLVVTVPVRNLSQVLMPTVRPVVTDVSTRPASAVDGEALARVTGRVPPDPQTVDLTDADVIFSAGKGCDQAVFEQLKDLCRLLNVSFGVTRPVFDLGWTGFERMVGQTGRTVTPRLYVALGISGSMHHVGGIKDSRRIVAVNSDPKAPIFTNSDEGFVADIREVLPRLLEQARAAAGGAA